MNGLGMMGRGLGLLTGFLCRLLEYALMVSVFVLVLDVLWGVFTRYVMKSPSPWTEEVATYLLMWVALLGSAVAYDRQAHLGLDYIVKKLDPQAQRFNAVVVHILVIVFAALVMAWGGYMLVDHTLRANQLTAALRLPMGYVYMAVPISGVFIILFAVEQIVEVVTGHSRRPPTSAEQAIDYAPAEPLASPTSPPADGGANAGGRGSSQA